MKTDIILAGVGGQGILSLGALIAKTAMHTGMHVKQSEVHGMAQRGGAVLAHLRLSDQPIQSDLIPRGGADLLISMELLESLRYLEYLSAEGTLLTATTTILNIPDYPQREALEKRIRELPHAVLVDAERLAKQAGTVQAANVVVVGAAAHLLPFEPAEIEAELRRTFQSKGEKVVEANLRAFLAGQETVPCVKS